MLYKLRFSKRVKRVRIEVIPGEVRVVAPFGTGISQIDLFVLSNKAWIKKKLSLFEKIQPCILSMEGKTALFGELLTNEDVLSLAVKDEMDLSEWFDAQLLSFLAKLLSKYPMLVPNRIRLGNAKTRWGSCNAKGTIMINRKLVHAPLSVIEYVLVHELVHLKYKNHSVHFWSKVGSLFGNYSEEKIWLRNQGAFL